ncbi:hypothetical protein FRC06_004199 [Ceratobasidium sp. 370]|nr:hypothetical protein FRC06_004199 [Ceratobasidium sp. 370]
MVGRKRPSQSKFELEEHEQGSEGLNKLLETYFFEEDEMVYSTWPTSQLQMWLISRQFIPREEAYTLERASLVEPVERNFLAAEMSSCHGWAPAEAASDKGVFIVLAKYFNKGSDATAEYMVWPDARLRTFLRVRGVKEPKKVKKSRSHLIHVVRVRAAQKQASKEDLVKQLQNVLTSGAEWSEEQLLASLAILGGTKHRGAGEAMREASRFVMDSISKEENIKAEQARLRAEL